MLSLAKPHHFYQNFLSQGLGMGLAMGILFLPGLSITSHYFRARRSTSMGIVFAGASGLLLEENGISKSLLGASLGGVIWPIMLNNLFEMKSTGFPRAVR